MDYAGAWHHVMNRGIERREVFLDDDDRRAFIRLLSELEENFGVEVHAYCLMDNHYHLALHTHEANLSRAMRWLGQSYSQGFNRRHDRVGPLFQGRFKSLAVDPEDWLTQLSVYIHLNPLRVLRLGLGKADDKRESAGLGEHPGVKVVDARLKGLRAYRWSSYVFYGGYRKCPEWFKTKKILGSFGKTINEQRQGYRRFVKERLKRGTEESWIERFRDEIAIGGAGFVERLRNEFREGVTRETSGRKRMERTLGLDVIIGTVEKFRGEPKENWLKRHGDEGKWMILLLARHRSGMTLRELGEAFGGMDYVAVSVGVSRYEKKLTSNKAIKRRFNQVAKMLNVKT